MNALVVQCGGPTPVFNASLAAVIGGCQQERAIRQLWGARLGLQGLLAGDWVDLTQLPATSMDRLREQPGAALGSSRYFLADTELDGLLAQLAARRIGAVFFIGGGGTMAAAHKLAGAVSKAIYRVQSEPLRVIGIPKTVDNDLSSTDVAPGYGSSARFVAQTTHDIGLDLQTMRTFDDVAVLEVMGRHAGWLAAASALARQAQDDAPDLILLPEVVFAEEAFLAQVRRIHKRKGVCLVAASEGIRDATGAFLAERLGETEVDSRGQKMLGLAAGPAAYLGDLVRRRLGLRCRQLKPDTIQRSSSGLASEVDRGLAEQVGAAAVVAATAGESDVMIGLVRRFNTWQTQTVPLMHILGQERVLPPTYYQTDGWDVTPDFLDYARPLVGELAVGAVQL
jgi:6-phosphofructokinase 1